MQKVSVEVKPDHLQRLAGVSPVQAVSELIWNGLDADATNVSVDWSENQLGGLSAIRISDNGTGLPLSEARDAFGSLGGSVKRRGTRTTKGGRLLHGAEGKGRFRAFALGGRVTWTSRTQGADRLEEYTIQGRIEDPGVFEIGDSAASSAKTTGMVVEIDNIQKDHPSLTDPSATQKFTEEFALYLRRYPTVSVRVAGHLLDPKSVEEQVAEYTLPSLEVEDGKIVSAVLTIIEWKVKTGRSLSLCDENGFTLHQTKPGIQAPGFENFTAYLKSDYLRVLNEGGLLVLDEMHPGLEKLLEAAKGVIREHFRRRGAEKAGELVEAWKREEIYPYEGDPKSAVERIEREVFDVVALNVSSYSPDFEASDARSRRLAFRLLKQAVESSPAAVQEILQDVLQLPLELQSDLAELIKRTPLARIIKASKVVADRLDFLAGLEQLVFDEPSRSTLLERRQLHRILEQETWIFGEEFNLSGSELTLTNVLRKHLASLDIELSDDAAPVTTENGKSGRVDLLFGRVVPQPKEDEREYLVVELKRPIQKLDDDAVLQVKRYARALASDERFASTKTRWVFYLVGNEMADPVWQEARQPNRTEGILFEDPDKRYRIWSRTWSEVIRGAKARLEFFRKELEYNASDETAMAYLRATHEKYLPKTKTETAKG